MTCTPATSACLFAVLAASFAGAPAFAQTLYKRVDADGRVTYSSEPLPGGKPMVLQPLTTIPAPHPAAARVPAADVETQRSESVRASDRAAQATGRYEDKPGTLTEQVANHERRVEGSERKLATPAARPVAAEAKR